MPDIFYYKEPLSPVYSEIHGPSENAIIATLVANRKNYLYAKRVLDIVFSVLVISFVLSWLLPLVSFWIILDSKGPVFFSQRRMGRDGKIFRCFKFRTMKVNADADEKPAEENDARITTAGKFLRITNIDELPQFLNVLLGNMSVTGPRPHMLADCARFSFLISSYKFRTLIKPGITGLAQVKGYHGPATEFDGIMNRYYWDAIYVRKASIGLDLRILLKTIGIGCRTLLSILLSSKNR